LRIRISRKNPMHKRMLIAGVLLSDLLRGQDEPEHGGTARRFGRHAARKFPGKTKTIPFGHELPGLSRGRETWTTIPARRRGLGLPCQRRFARNANYIASAPPRHVQCSRPVISDYAEHMDASARDPRRHRVHPVSERVSLFGSRSLQTMDDSSTPLPTARKPPNAVAPPGIGGGVHVRSPAVGILSGYTTLTRG